jgi:hypothetical protein
MSKLARDHRNRELAMIHMAKAELLRTGKFQSDDDYRAMLWTQARVKSAAELDHAGRQTVMAYLRSLGFDGRKGSGRARPVRAPLTAPQKLMWSLWQQLADAGKADGRKMASLMAYIKRQTGVERLEWLTKPQESLVIESLKQWLGRPQ